MYEPQNLNDASKGRDDALGGAHQSERTTALDAVRSLVERQGPGVEVTADDVWAELGDKAETLTVGTLFAAMSDAGREGLLSRVSGSFRKTTRPSPPHSLLQVWVTGVVKPHTAVAA